MNVAGCANRGLFLESSCLDFMRHSTFDVRHSALTHFHISPSVGAFPCISSPVRKILPAAWTRATAVAPVTTTDTRICHIGGPGAIAMRSSIKNGVAVGKNDQGDGNRLSLSCTD